MICLTQGSAKGTPLLLCLGFFLLSIATTARGGDLEKLSKQAYEHQLSAHPVWKALLHQRGESSLIEDPRFILSRPHYTAARELEATLNLFFSGSAHEQRAAICRFPARYSWLVVMLEVTDTHDPVSTCPAMAEFFSRAPAERIDLIFASENLTSPSSMMGHVLLRLSGSGPDGRPASHAVSYFTEINGINVPRILFESLVTGKPGYYTLSPYRQKEAFYRQHEQRNLWEYSLVLSLAQRRLIRLHLWELRSAQLSYYFHRYNCATLTRYLLAIADPGLLKNPSLWTTPLDVVRALQGSPLLGSVEALPSDRWLSEALSQQLPASLITQARAAVAQGTSLVPGPETSPQQHYLALEFSNAWAGYAAAADQLDPGVAERAAAAAREQLQTEFPHQRIDLSQYKSPVRRPQDSQWRAGLLQQAGTTQLQLGFLAASHRLEDGNRQSFSESALQLGDVTATLDPQRRQIELQELEVYAMTSLSPVNALTGGFTGRVRFGVEPHYDAQLRARTAANVSGGLGLTVRLSRDTIVYGLAGGGLGWVEGGGYLYGEPEVGAVIDEVWAMKSLLRARALLHQVGRDQPAYELSWTQTKALGHTLLLAADYAQVRDSQQLEHRWGLSIKRYF